MAKRPIQIKPNNLQGEVIVQNAIFYNGLHFSVTPEFKGKVTVQNCVIYGPKPTLWGRFNEWRRQRTLKMGRWPS